jgi:hypothetical protein
MQSNGFTETYPIKATGRRLHCSVRWQRQGTSIEWSAELREGDQLAKAPNGVLFNVPQSVDVDARVREAVKSWIDDQMAGT